MDSAGKPEKSVEKAMKNLKIDSSAKTAKPNLHRAKVGTSSDDSLCISSGDVRENEMNQESSIGSQGLYCYGYAYPGFNGLISEWHDGNHLIGANGLEYYPAVMQTDGSYVYYLPDYQTGYASHTPFLHGALISPDGQYYSPGILSPTNSYSPEWAPGYTWDQYLLLMDGFQGTAVTGKPVPSSKSSYVTRSKISPVKSILETKGSPSSIDHSLKPGNKVIGSATSKSGILHPINLAELKATKSKTRVKYNGLQNNGSLTPSEKNVMLRTDVYNLSDFQTKYEQAMFFVIKSYSEDDVHKSIKYNVWASTPNGNKRLDSAFTIAQEMSEKGTKCPVFLFFSVKFPQGIEMLKIFKSYSYKTSILDDFEYYENRQKALQDRRSKPSTPSTNHPLIETGKPLEETTLGNAKVENISGGVKVQKESIISK